MQNLLDNSDRINEFKVSVNNLNLFFGKFNALKNINLNIKEKQIIALIGPSGCGKSTFLKTLNRMNDLTQNCKVKGKILIDGEDIYSPKTNVSLLRKKAGMVAQIPNPFPMSIFNNVAYGPKIHGIKNKKLLSEIVEKSLKGAAIWDELKDKLNNLFIFIWRTTTTPLHCACFSS